MNNINNFNNMFYIIELFFFVFVYFRKYYFYFIIILKITNKYFLIKKYLEIIVNSFSLNKWFNIYWLLILLISLILILLSYILLNLWSLLSNLERNLLIKIRISLLNNNLLILDRQINILLLNL